MHHQARKAEDNPEEATAMNDTILLSTNIEYYQPI